MSIDPKENRQALFCQKSLKKSSINCRNMAQNKVKKQKINNKDIEILVFEER